MVVKKERRTMGLAERTACVGEESFVQGFWWKAPEKPRVDLDVDGRAVLKCR